MWSEAFDNLLRAHLTVPPDEPLPPDAVLADYGLDSQGTVSLLIGIEDEFAVSFPDDLVTTETFTTAGALRAAVASLLSQPDAEPTAPTR